jgi:hypothetical protein
MSAFRTSHGITATCATYEPYVQACLFTTGELKERLASLMAAMKTTRTST